jgi:hypothetical protein
MLLLGAGEVCLRKVIALNQIKFPSALLYPQPFTYRSTTNSDSGSTASKRMKDSLRKIQKPGLLFTSGFCVEVF